MFKRLLILFLLLGAVIGGVVWLKLRQMEAGAAMMSAPRPPITIASTEVASESWQPVLRAVGSLVAVSGIDLSAEVSGTVSEIRFDSGDRVEKGQLLLQLDDAVDRAAMDAARAEQTLARIEFERAQELLPKKAVSRADYDKAKAGLDAAAAMVAKQQATLALKSIRAPFGGVLGIRQVDPGQYLQPGEPIASLQAMDPIYADFSLPERHLAELQVGMKVEVSTDAYRGERFAGEISAVGNGIDAGTRTVHLRATLANKEARLRPGMFAEVRVLQPMQDEVLTIPRTAVSFNTYGDFVYVIEESDGKLRVKRRQIETGTTREGRVEVVKGLESGERVVRAGLVKLRDGAAVQIDDSVQLDDGAAAR